MIRDLSTETAVSPSVATLLDQTIDARTKPSRQDFDGPGALIDIHSLIRDAINDAFAPIDARSPADGQSTPRQVNRVRIHFRNMAGMVAVTDSLPIGYRFGEEINLFLDASSGIRHLWHNHDPVKPELDSFYPVSSPLLNEQITGFNHLVSEIKRLYFTGGYKRRIADEARRLDERHSADCQNIDQIFAAVHRVIVVRIDLEYRSEYRDQVTLQQLSDDIDHLRRNFRHNSIFDGLVTVFFKLEYGVDCGPHAHAVFFFDGSIRLPSSHIHLASEICKYWNGGITRGMGRACNCNADTEKYVKQSRLGIGPISYHQLDLIANLKQHVFSYFVKADQLIRVIDGPTVRRFRWGQVPEINPRRPRTKTPIYGMSSDAPMLQPQDGT